MVGQPKCYFVGSLWRILLLPFAIQEAIPLTTDIVASDNTLLTRDAAEVEVYQVVFQLSPSKALGLNGRHAIFFQKF